MKRLTLTGLALAVAAFGIAAVAAGTPDGAVIRNSGSTNTPRYEIKVWSDGRGEVTVGNSDPKTIMVDPQVVASFFTDVRAARSAPREVGRCMKSASFGSTTTVLWHGWTSVDLQCAPYPPAVQALAMDVAKITSGANITVMIHHRIPLPREPRMIPSESPEVSPT